MELLIAKKHGKHQDEPELGDLLINITLKKTWIKAKIRINLK